MPDRRLQVFHTVAGVLSFTRAAEKLHMTQPAVAHHIRQLEQELNTRLFDRVNNRIRLTVAGRQVHEHASDILERYEQMHEAVKRLTGDTTGLVTLGASTTIAEYMLPGLLGGFRTRFPQVQICLRVANTETIVASVADSDIDLGVVEGAVAHQGLRVEHCQTDELVVVMPPGHTLCASDEVAAEALPGFPFISREVGSGTRSVVAGYLHNRGLSEVDLNQPFELGSTEAIKGAVQAGMGISILSRATIVNELQLGVLAMRPLAPALVRPFFFVRQRQPFQSYLMEELFAFAQHYCQNASVTTPAGATELSQRCHAADT